MAEQRAGGPRAHPLLPRPWVTCKTKPSDIPEGPEKLLSVSTVSVNKNIKIGHNKKFSWGIGPLIPISKIISLI